MFQILIKCKQRHFIPFLLIMKEWRKKTLAIKSPTEVGFFTLGGQWMRNVEYSSTAPSVCQVICSNGYSDDGNDEKKNIHQRFFGWLIWFDPKCQISTIQRWISRAYYLLSTMRTGLKMLCGKRMTSTVLGKWKRKKNHVNLSNNNIANKINSNNINRKCQYKICNVW